MEVSFGVSIVPQVSKCFFSGNAIYKWMRTGGIPIEDWKYLEKVYADLPVGTHAHTQLWKTTHV